MEQRLDIQTVKIKLIIEDYRSGRLVIPEFQREYVWKKSSAPHLIDSIYRSFPISALLLWSSDADVRSRRRDPKPVRGNSISWLIDGQQRVITLSRILSGDEGIEVVFNPDEDAFRLANAATAKDDNWVPVSEILDDELHRQLRKSLPDGLKGEKREIKFENVRRLLEYEIPAVHMRDFSFDQAVDAFIERAEHFLEARRELLAEAFNGFLRKMLPNRRILA